MCYRLNRGECFVDGPINPELLSLELETGRKNQIRVHLADLKHPVAGDKKYGARTNPLGRLGLHAAGLVFVHPVSQKTMTFSLPVPRRFTHTVEE